MLKNNQHLKDAHGFFRRVLVILLCLALAASLSGCHVTARVYGKPLDPLADVDLGYGRVYLGTLMDALAKEDISALNELGYHAGAEDAITFESVLETWQALKPIYGPVTATYLDEGYQYGDEKVYVGVLETESGQDLKASLMFTSKDELVQAFLYETSEGFWKRQEIPEGIVEEELILGEGTAHPLQAKITRPAVSEDADGSLSQLQKLPAVVMVGGDGGNTMDMQAGSTKAYQDLAWALAEQGIVTIRFDKRTYAYSDEESAEEAPLDVFTVWWEYGEDALLAYEMLLEQPFVDPEQVYYLGHSQGAVVGSRIDGWAKEQGLPGFAGFALLSTSPRPWYDVVYDQYINYGLIDHQADEIYYLVQKVEMERDYIKEGDYLKTKEDRLNKDFALNRAAGFWKDYLSFDYVKAYQALAEAGAKVLIVQGEEDYQIKMDPDFAAWKTEVAGWGDVNVRMISFPGLNHLLTPSQGVFAGHYKEYDMPGRVPEEVSRALGEWMLE
ncbi:MAG: hypothetical protein J6P72_09570 [Firmicutes bacterium]|nr:hypothetical protein [Bacillota bacterium]